ncbi:hypothetical protein KIH23_10125 [Flavobacterium sp. CYK-55]|uniref:hypothetical protein n=1 Tax=Flavobacterium sp. CYK-55 TaxID=2835529 RepID=UPI001BCD21CA|nr:hypothetical protein [Flavobacterium sp. CYK-55]MBS7787654.1 hypothetical protein [Flavobacterium sp. CYK-55]
MNNILEDLKSYFRETPREKVLKDWNGLDYLDEVGPTVDEFLEISKILYEYRGHFWKEEENCNILANPKFNLRVSF